MHSTSHDLPATLREQLVALLNVSLADAIHLGLQAKQAHWNVKGPSFIALHELFDKIAEATTEFVDDLAERITALGGTADGTLTALTTRSTLAAYPLNITSGTDHVRHLAKALAHFGAHVRKRIDETTDLKDAGTADLYTGISRETDKLLWFVEAHVQG